MVVGFAVGLWGGHRRRASERERMSDSPEAAPTQRRAGIVRRAIEPERMEDVPEAARRSYERGARWRAACPWDCWKLAEDCGPEAKPRGGGDWKGVGGKDSPPTAAGRRVAHGGLTCANAGNVTSGATVCSGREG